MATPHTRARYWVGVVAIAACHLAYGIDLQFRVENISGAGLENAIVYLTPQTPVAHAAPAKTRIDQVDRTFVPRISVVQAGTPIEFPNSDNIRHSVYSFSPAKVFTLNLYAGKPANPVVFDKPGIVALGCNIHDRMLAWLLVVDTPYFARTNSDGLAAIANVPPGDYRVRAWHEPISDEPAGELLHVDSATAPARTIRIDAATNEAAH
jgi:plastocyanin